MILIITGNGKGKTTSAIGTAIRSAGWKKKTAIVFFDKGGSFYGEQHMLEKMAGSLDSFRFGLTRFDEESRTFRFENTEADRLEAKRGIQSVLDLFRQDYFLIVLDEIINCLNLGLIKRVDLESLLEACPTATHLTLTGRNVPEWLAERADLVSEVREVKHYFRKGKDAVKGIDY
jgi:cob(I)alamin adenosyltransferase